MMRTDRKVLGLQQALKRLAQADGRIARRNARRAVFGALRAIRRAVDHDYPAVPKPAKQRTPEQQDAALIVGKSWRTVEYRIVTPGRRRWDRQAAQDFVAHWCQLHGLPPKPIRFDLPDRGRLLGEHTADAIRMKALPTWWGRRTTDPEKWRTFLHELAHYRAHGHGRAFKLELLLVWRTWKAWMAERQRPAADRQAAG